MRRFFATAARWTRHSFEARVLCLCLAAVSACAAREPSASGTASPNAPASLADDGLIASPEPGWPQWRGPRRDGISIAKGLRKRWPANGPPLLWKIDGLGRGWSSPIIVGEQLFVTGDLDEDLVVFAFDLDGKPRWQTRNGKSWTGSFPGSRACCAFSEGRLYHMNAHGRVACLDADSGGEIWAVNILERFDGENITWALSECLLVDGPRVIVTPGGTRALMAALDKRTGDTVWTTPPPSDDPTSHCSPILFRHGGRRVIAQCSSAHGFGADADSGELLWTVPLKNRYGTNVSTPIYGAGSVFYVTPYAELGRLYGLRSDGRTIAAEHAWTCPLDTVTGSGVLVDGTLFAAGYGKPKWWFGIDWRTGETRFELEDFTTGAAVYADERLYVLDERGNVGLLAPRPDRLEVAGRFQLFDRRARDAWAHPVVLDGRLYLRYHDTLWCFDISI